MHQTLLHQYRLYRQIIDFTDILDFTDKPPKWEIVGEVGEMIDFTDKNETLRTKDELRDINSESSNDDRMVDVTFNGYVLNHHPQEYLSSKTNQFSPNIIFLDAPVYHYKKC